MLTVCSGRRRLPCGSVTAGQVCFGSAAQEDRRDHGAEGCSVDVGQFDTGGVALIAVGEVLGHQLTVMA